MVDQFLKRHGFINKKEEDLQEQDGTPRRNYMRTTQEGSGRLPARSQPRQAPERHRDSPAARDGSTSGRHHTRLEHPRSPSQMPPPQLVPRRRPALSVVEDTSSRKLTPNRRRFEDSGLAGDEQSRGRLTVESSGKRHKWIENIVAVRSFLQSHHQTSHFSLAILLISFITSLHTPNSRDHEGIPKDEIAFRHGDC